MGDRHTQIHHPPEQPADFNTPGPNYNRNPPVKKADRLGKQTGLVQKKRA